MNETIMSGGTSALVGNTAIFHQAESLEKKKRIAETVNFFNLLYGKITTPHFAYLWTKQRGIFPFQINDESQRVAMAKKAVELSDSGVDVWHSVNPVCVEPTNEKRGDELVVSYQIACVIDIDIRSVAHKGDPTKLAANFDEAKSFLPFTPSLLIYSGYGLHAYYIFNTPIKITDDNREQLKRRNNLLIDVTRTRANGKTIDGVGDLPRVMRTPGTFNYKLGKENAPVCHIVEDSGLRFSPDDLDEKLNTLILAQKTKAKTNSSTSAKFYDDFGDDRDFDIFRVRRMLDFIAPSNLSYDDWLSVGMTLKNVGCDYSDWEQWSRADERFKEGECERKWNGFNRVGYDIGTVCRLAQLGDYDAGEIYREWHELHPQLNASTNKKANDDSKSQIDSLKAELREVAKSLIDFDNEKKAALEKLRNVETFDSDTLFSEEILQATAFARVFDKKAFSDFRGEITARNRNTKDKKVSVNDWLADVKDRADEISSRQNDLLARQTEIQSQIHSLSFIANNDFLQGLSFPNGYSITKEGGIVKINGEKIIPVCRRPVAITAKTFSVEEKIFKLKLAYQMTSGKWKTLPATEAATVFNKNKLVDLSNNGLPVTSSNATALVDFLDAFNATNEDNFPITYTVPRCGWHEFDGEDCFVDPRRKFSVTDDDKNISVSVDSLSPFANALHLKGSFEAWKKAYKLAKKSPVARLIVAASVAPPLLKVLGERNFLLYIYAPTRAGKTTALYLGASAVGSEKIIRSFDATKNGLAGAAADVNDYPFLIDEKQVADNRIKEQLDTLVYALANGIGRTKLNKDSSLKKIQDWRTIPIMTGETLLLPDNVTGGANTRLLTVSAPKVILDANSCREIRDIIKDNYGHSFLCVIDKISAIGSETLRKVYNDIVDFFAEKYPDILEEYRRYMAIITLADTLLNSALFGNKIITDNGTAIKPKDDAIINFAQIFPLLPTTTEISDTVREKEFVLGVITQNQNRFIGGNIPLDRMQAISGKFDTDYVYITVAALKQACSNEGFDYKKVAADLIDDGFFVPDDKIEKGYKKPRSTVKIWLAKSATNCYRIRVQMFGRGDKKN